MKNIKNKKLRKGVAVVFLLTVLRGFRRGTGTMTGNTNSMKGREKRIRFLVTLPRDRLVSNFCAI